MRGFTSALFCVLLVSSFISVFAQTKPTSSPVRKDSIITQLAHQLQAARQDTTQLSLLTLLINRCRELEQFDLGSHYVQRGFQLAHRTKDPIYLGRFYSQAGDFTQHQQKYPQVITILKQAIYYLQQTSLKKETSLALYRLARAYAHRDMQVEEFKQIQQNLAYAKQINYHHYDVSNYAILYTYYAKRGNKIQAFATLENMLSLAQRYKIPSDLTLAYANLGEYYDLQHHYIRGLIYHQKALAAILSQGNKDVNYVSQSYYAIANNLFQQNRFSEAQAVLTHAIELNKKAGIILPGNLFRVQALLLERQHRLGEAAQWINKILPNFRAANPSELTTILEILIRIQQKRGRFQDAYWLLKEQKLVSDSLKQVDKNIALANLEARSELQRQNHQMILLQKEMTLNHLEMVRTRQRQWIIGGLAFSLLLLAIGSIWAAKTAHKHVETLQKQTQQIQQQAQHLRDLNNVKDTLFSVIGHDLRTPILYLRTTLRQLSQPSVDQRLFNRQVTQLNLSVNTVYATLDNLLHWSVIQRNHLLVTKPSRVDMATLIQHELMLFEPMITQKALEIELGEGPHWALVDQMQAQIILRNIIHNACKFTPMEGQITIDYQTIDHESIVRITDTGIGMRTVGEAQSPQGTGLGLVVAQEFLTLNGGRMAVTSQPGEGTVVELFFSRPTTGSV